MALRFVCKSHPNENKGRVGVWVNILLNVVSAFENGIWTKAIPRTFSGLRMKPTAYRLTLKYRTGQNVFSVS